MAAPIILSLYNSETGEVKTMFSQLFVPWKLLKKAVKLKDIDQANIKEEDLDSIGALVVETFGGRFTLDELNDGCDIGEMMTVITAIVTRATGGSTNPTPPG